MGNVDSSTWKDEYGIREIRELQDHDLIEISCQINEPKTLRHLAAKLNITPVTVYSALANHKDGMYEATYQVLKTWFADQVNQTYAFTSMCKALSQIGESSIISEVLLNNDDILSERL